ncbi:MAG TPA: response regulator transcription factor [Hydrogenophaga sp.]|uniref:response regulator transcription factor n=1 Tax=Hydrogenophaga sp. TaxID=1904254 RepID=UPI002C1E2FC0|nr:response regulator transcription factor [Hydrogenophaga sp.]HMN94464.1 response regulator transcription factor [Hydrogenophaga sp.]HMP11166.1 response regulator transcription factor [Hydrogenophaga sp.]
MITSSERTDRDGAPPLTRIFLIEDDPSIVRFVRDALVWRPQWRLVGHADSVSQARDMAVQAAADVYLVDLALPDGRGEEVLQWLASQVPSAELLVFTVFGEESRLVGALQAGATGYVLKGCSVDDLLNAIEQIRHGGAPISPLLARMLLRHFKAAPDHPGEPLSSVPESVSLSDREAEVLRLVARGYVNREIAEQLCISPATVGTHIKNLYRKLSVHSRVQVVRVAQERGLL